MKFNTTKWYLYLSLVIAFVIFTNGATLQAHTYGDAFPTAAEAAFVHPSAADFNGVQIDPDTSRLIPSAFNVVQTFETGLTPTRWVYVGMVDAHGADDNNPGTFEQPFATIGRAFDVATAGTAIRILPGDYTAAANGGERHTNVGWTWNHLQDRDAVGTAEAPIWIGGVPGMEKPILQRLTIVIPRYLIVHNLEIRQTEEYHGLHINDGGEFPAAHNLVVRNVHVTLQTYNLSQFRINGINYAYFFDNYAGVDTCERIRTDNYWAGDWQHAAALNTNGGHNWQVAYNYFHNFTMIGIKFKSGSTNIDIFGNLLVNPGYTALQLGQAGGVDAFRPTRQAGDMHGTSLRAFSNIVIGGYNSSAFTSSRYSYIVNNTLILPASNALLISRSEPYEDALFDAAPHYNTFANNVVITDRYNTVFSIDRHSLQSVRTFTVENNLFYNIDSPNSPPIGRASPLANINYILANPLIKNDAGILASTALNNLSVARRAQNMNISPADLILQLGSPAAYGGVVFDFVHSDFFGRPFNDYNPSLGAIQFVATAVSDTTDDSDDSGISAAMWALFAAIAIIAVLLAFVVFRKLLWKRV